MYTYIYSGTWLKYWLHTAFPKHCTLASALCKVVDLHRCLKLPLGDHFF